LEHSESLDDQKESLKRYKDLASTHGSEYPVLQGFLKYAIDHHDLIEKFSRFPHRNAVLGRQDTPAERDYLNSLGKSQNYGVSINKPEEK
jgi:uncharacterized protein (DUF924 family)